MREVLIGWDSREKKAWEVCARSIIRNAKIPPSIRPIGIQTLGDLYKRPTERRDGRLFDVISNAPMATEFALARFFTPIVGLGRWVLFCDADFMFRADINDLFDLADNRFAVMVVKHDYVEAATEKMDGQRQTSYPRKNWSSLMLWNMAHAGHKRIWADDANRQSGLWLHQFSWLKDHEIGELPKEWNWLEGVDDNAIEAKGVHFTRGTPDMLSEPLVYGGLWKDLAWSPNDTRQS